MKTLQMFTGMTRNEIKKDIKEKELVLNWMVKHNINIVDDVGRVVAEYYTDKNKFMKIVRSNKPFIFNKKEIAKTSKKIENKKKSNNLKKKKMPAKKSKKSKKKKNAKPSKK